MKLDRLLMLVALLLGTSLAALGGCTWLDYGAVACETDEDCLGGYVCGPPSDRVGEGAPGACVPPGSPADDDDSTPGDDDDATGDDDDATGDDDDDATVALEVALNDSVDLDAFIDGGTAPASCPCFCTYEGFAATLTAPADMTLNYVYLLYGSSVSVSTAFDVHIYDGPTPGDAFHFIQPNGDPLIAEFLLFSSSTTEIIEVDLVASGLTPPALAAGQTFTIDFRYAYDPADGISLTEPDNGHGPAFDDDGDLLGRNWLYAWQGGGCGTASDTYLWSQSASLGLAFDFVIRASNGPVDWTLWP